MARAVKATRRAARPPVRASRAGGATSRELAKGLAAARAQQKATAEILRVMAVSPGDVEPVLDAIVRRAARLCQASFARVILADNGMMRPGAQYVLRGRRAPKRMEPVPLRRTAVTGRAVLERRTIHIEDIVPLLDREYPDARVNALPSGFRTVLAVPLRHGTDVAGAILLWRKIARKFTPDQVALIETFARQAAIAIDNARRFHETREALEQQSATAEILHAISASPGELEPVLDTVVKAAARFCDADNVVIVRVDGDVLRGAAAVGSFGETIRRQRGSLAALEIPINRRSVSGRAVVDRCTVHTPDLAAESETEFPVGRDLQRQFGHRANVMTPLLREGEAIGAIGLFRYVPRPFSDRQIELLRVFASQVVIAIENVRLFSELEQRNAALTRSLEQQTATSEILRVISQSATNIQPVFESIVKSSLALCDAAFSGVYLLEGDLFSLTATAGLSEDEDKRFRSGYPRRIGADTVSGLAALECRVVQTPDLINDPQFSAAPGSRVGARTVLGVPMMREDKAIGSIGVWRSEVKPFSDAQIALLQTFADQAVIAIENVRLFNALQERNAALSESLEQQTATSEILRVISRSPTDVQPVFETIADAARRLCRASSVNVFTFDGKLLHVAAIAAEVDEAAAFEVRRHYPKPPGRSNASTRAILERRVVSIPDVLADPEYDTKSAAIGANFRSMVSVPLLRGDEPIGAITVGRAEAGDFPAVQIGLLRTFADQAVIAIENVRLFTELQERNAALREALEQQTATSEILRVISRSPTDVQPVFDTIAAAVLKLCRATSANLLSFDGEQLHIAALANVDPNAEQAFRAFYPRRINRDTAVTRAVLTRDVVAIPDILEDADYAMRDAALAGGFRSVLGIPLLRDGDPIGAIAVGRPEPGPFTAAQIELVKTFADQAVIAIENVRLFKELQSSNRDLSEALEQQTATSEILRVISGSPTDVQPVFDTIVAAALKLCGAVNANLLTFDGELIHLGALVNTTSKGTDAIRAIWPRRPSRDMAATRAILTCSTVVIQDVLDDPDFAEPRLAIAGGFRSILAVPLVREGSPIGAIAIGRSEAGQFPDSQIQLLQTFADQAVIAIDNVRLFTELQARNREITEALEQQTATSEILRVISASPRDVQPVFDAIAAAALKLCAAGVAMVARYDGTQVELVAIANIDPAGEAALREVFPRPPSLDTTSGRAVLHGEVVMIEDVLADADYKVQDHALKAGFRSTLAVPLMRSGQPIGSITVGRPNPGPFGDDQVALLQTFADQAVIAIRNVQLFSELDARTAELSRSVGELRALGEVGQAVSSTLDLETVLRTIVVRAAPLAGGDGGSIWEYDEVREEFHLRASDRLPDELVDRLRAHPIRKGEGALGRLAMTSEAVQIFDVSDERSYKKSEVGRALLRAGLRSILAVPLLRENHLLGALAINRSRTGGFEPKVIALLETFATQSALAIQNARLFRELEDKGRQLELASRHKSEFLANMSHELRTPLNAIIGFSEVLSERLFGELNDKQAEYVADIIESGRHLLALINDILDLSKIEAGRMELEPAEFQLPGAIDNALTLVREKADRHGIRIERSVDPRLGAIHGDERKVKQVLLNLLSNALKFTPDGGRIGVKASVCDGMAEISVSDNGVGIAAEDQAAVFEEFRQVGTSAKRREGTGLGLPISRKFIELHGGRLWLQSSPGAGSTFTFTLPLDASGALH